MIELYASTSPNVHKIIIMLEEIGLEYRLRAINVHRGEQYTPEFTALNPNRKVPVIVDHDGPSGQPFTVFESGAILLYLAEKAGQLVPSSLQPRYEVLQWLMIQLTGIGPMFGQFNHFQRFAAADSYGIRRFESEARRLYDLLEGRLGSCAYLGGPDYSIADIAVWPWIRVEARLFGRTHPVMQVDWDGHPHLTRWYRCIETRPAVSRALAVIDTQRSTSARARPDELDRYFGRGNFARTLTT